MNDISALNPGVVIGREDQGNELEKLRNKHREEKLAYRERQREFFLNRARFLEEKHPREGLSESDIRSMAKSLKTKSQVSCELLTAVMNSLLNNKDNISAFLKVDGALQALLRILSGQNERYQLVAAQCICNLALGSKKESFQVLKASESYLMMHLSGRNTYVKEACVIALGNFSRHSMKHVELLMNQGFFSKIINILKDSDPNLESSAIYALTQFIYYGCDYLKVEDLENCMLVVVPIFKKRSFSVAFLMSTLSSCQKGHFCLHHPFLLNEIHKQAIKCLLISLHEEDKEALYYFRIVSNSMSEGSGQIGKDLIENQGSVVRECIRYLLQSKEKYLKKECLSLIGNLLNHPVDVLRAFAEELIKENLDLIQEFMRMSGGSEEMIS